MTQLVVSLKELTDVKLALDAEIATYRRLLMAEDGRWGSYIHIHTHTRHTRALT